MSTAIKFSGVSKKFTLHQDRSRSVQESLISLFKARSPNRREEIWVLKDVNFEIEHGETVAFIGPNGTGKSTSLKLISGVLFPDAGQIEVNGRLGALLELGAGFHPDLTGRENIYLNAAILGFSRLAIQSKIDEIIAFSEIEKFIDAPVKHYSSGMYMRLGFSVAIHTDPEILLVDEVLAVGDANFQRKCADKFDDLRRKGTTILLVSHSLDVVKKTCRRAIWMEKGEIVADGSVETVTQHYLQHIYEQSSVVITDVSNRRWGSGEVEINRVCLLNDKGIECNVFQTGDPVIIEIHYKASLPIEHPVFGLAIHRGDGILVTGPNTQFMKYEITSIEGKGVVQYKIPSLSLLEGTYYVSVAVENTENTQTFDYHDRLYPFRVIACEREKYGVVTLNGSWHWNH